MYALAPFRKPLLRVAYQPRPLPYLDSEHNRAAGAIGIGVEVWLQAAQMRKNK